MRESILLIVVLVFVLVATASCAIWRWNECRSVGHSVLWCIGEQGRR